MKRVMTTGFVALLLLCASVAYADKQLAADLQSASVTIETDMGSGSAVLVTRNGVTYALTAAHVVDSVRTQRSVVQADGSSKTVVEFGKVMVVRTITQSGREVGKIRLESQVIHYSDSEDGQDLAVLRLRYKSLKHYDLKFLLEGDMISPSGTKLSHVGSLLGAIGSGSYTEGVMSKVGRILDLGNQGGVVFDQTSVTAFPGSSGGGVFLRDGPNKGAYIGMLVRGAGETYNLLSPIRRLHKYAKARNLLWLIDPSVDPPKDLGKIPLE